MTSLRAGQTPKVEIGADNDRDRPANTQESAMALSSCVIDIGSPKAGNLGWACAAMGGGVETGTDLDSIITWVAAELSVGSVALGFEAPMFIPLRDAPNKLTAARVGEGSKAWSAAAGCGALATGLAITVYTLARLRDAMPSASASLNWRAFEPAPGRLLLFEAFVSGKDKSGSHVSDAAVALRYFASQTILGEIESALPDDGPVFSLLGAALLRAGWSEDLTLLSEPCLVVRPAAAGLHP
jgi:hypothetical protein